MLYSKEKLDAKLIASKLNSLSGSLSKKIVSVLGDKLIPKEKIGYASTSAGFSVSGNKTTRNLIVADDEKTSIVGSVVPLMIELGHQ